MQTAGQVQIELSANVARISADMSQVKKVVGDAMGDVTRVVSLAQSAFLTLGGVTSAGAFIHIIDGAIEAKVKLYNLSVQTGITVEALSGLGKVAKFSNTDLTDIASASNKLSKALFTQNEDSKGAAQAIAALGLKFKDFKALGAEQQFVAVAKAMGEFEDGTAKSAAAMLLYGKTGATLLPFLKELEERGFAVGKQTTESALEAKRYEDNLTTLKIAADAWKRELVDAVLPTMIAITTQFVDMRKEADSFNVTGAALKTTFETVAVLGANVAFVFSGVGREIGAIGAQAAAVARGDFAGASAIRDAVIEDGKRARADLTETEARILGLKPKISTAADFQRGDKDTSPVKRKQLALAELPDKSAVISRADADAERKAQLDKSLKFLKDNFALQKDVLKFNQDELDAIYAAGNVSLAGYYDQKTQVIAAGVQKELNELTDEQAAIEVELEKGGFKNAAESTKLETKLQEVVAKSANIERNAANASKLAVYDRAAAYKALAVQVEAFNANLLQSKGDDFGAAQLRNAQALLVNLKLAREATPLQSTGDFNREERRQENGTSLIKYVIEQGRLNDAATQFTEIQRRVGVATTDATRAEELYILRSTQGGAGLIEQEQGIYTIRATALVQLGELADKAKALAEESTKPEVIAAAKDLALAYAKAAEAVDPALTRLHTLGDEVGTSLTGIFDGALTKATSFNDVLNSIGNTLKTTFIKGFITAPLEKELQGTIRKFLDGNNGIADALRNGIGASAGKFKGASNDPSARNFENESDKASSAAEAAKALAAKQDPLLSQTVAVKASTDALASLTAAANGAATALGGKPAAGSTQVAQIDASGLFGKYAGTSNDPSAANYQNESDKGGATAASEKLGSSLALTKSNADQFSAALPIASSFLQSLGGEASIAGRALSLLPGIMQLIQSASGSSVSGLASLFSSGSVGSSASYAANDFIASANGNSFGAGGLQAFAKGDIFNSPTAFRFAKGSGFAPGVMGEAGPEAVMPLRRGADGRLGVSVGGEQVRVQSRGASGAGRSPDQIQIINNGSPANVSRTETEQKPDGTQLKRIFLEAFAEDINRGGPAAKAMQDKYGLNRQNQRRG